MDRRGFLIKSAYTALALVAAPLIDDAYAARKNTHRRSPQRASSLMTDKIYEGNYSYNDEIAEAVARGLYPMTLHDAVNRGIVQRRMKDLSLPLGIYDGEGGIDFVDGMRDMWNAKRGIKKIRSSQKRRNYFVRRVREDKDKSSLRDYRKGYIQNGIDMLDDLEHNKAKRYSGNHKRFLDTVSDVISPNVLLGYCLHELMPPGVDGRQINPAFKAWFVDRLFKEAGISFVEGYPARYDHYMSHGPFQMTNIAMPEVSRQNQYVKSEDRVPNHVQDFSGLQHHVNSAVMLAQVRWSQLGMHLQKHGLLKKFMKAFDKLDQREQQIVVAGLTASMHHLPGVAMKRTGYYIDRSNGRDMHYTIRPAMNGQLQKYYDSAAEAYLFMKEFHKFDEKYGRS